MCELLSLKLVRRKLEEGPSLILLFVSKINPQYCGQTAAVDSSTQQFTEYSVIKLYRKLYGLNFYFY